MKKGIILLPWLLATCQALYWTSRNCGFGSHVAVRGNVTDAICGAYLDCENIQNTDYGFLDKPRSDVAKMQACDAKAVCLWNAAEKKCGKNRDKFNNVCVPANPDGSPALINPICHNLSLGRCPRKLEVKRGCCPGNAGKYDGILITSSPDYVCCNTPCASFHASSESQPALCRAEDHYHLDHCDSGRAKRSVYGGPGDLGMPMGPDYNDVQLNPDVIENMFGMNPGRQMAFGTANEGFGFTGMTPQMGVNALEEIGVGKSKEAHTEEITVDDLMDVLIESLSKDKDVFDYNREINSDPWFQKQAFGGHTDKFSFINPWKFIDQIYGTPFGMSQASMTYGNMYGIDAKEFKAPAKGFENVGHVVHQNMMGGGGYGPGFGGSYGGGSYGGGSYGNQYGSQSYNSPPYGGNQYGGSQYGGSQYGASQYGGSQYGGSQYGGGNQYGQYGGGNQFSQYGGGNQYGGGSPYGGMGGMGGPGQYGNDQYAYNSMGRYGEQSMGGRYGEQSMGGGSSWQQQGGYRPMGGGMGLGMDSSMGMGQQGFGSGALGGGGMGMMGQESQGLGGPGFTSGDLYPLPGRGGMQMAGDGGYPDAPGGQGDFKKK